MLTIFPGMYNPFQLFIYTLSQVIRLLIANGADVNQPDIYGSRPLHVTCRMGRNAILQVLLENHARIDSYDNEGWTGLHLGIYARV